jgi:hypothetical protein
MKYVTTEVVDTSGKLAIGINELKKNELAISVRG